MKQYLDLVKHIIETGTDKSDRTGIVNVAAVGGPTFSVTGEGK